MENKNQQGAAGVGDAVTRENSPVYTIQGLGRELRQSEIITNLCQYAYDPVSGEGLVTPHPYVIILTQDCDLLWDFESASTGNATELNGVLVYQCDPAIEALKRLAGSDIRRRVKQNRDERYHFLEAVRPPLDLLDIGMPELIIDFKKYFTLPAAEIYRQCALGEGGAQRRCRLEMPYREHLQSRVAFYFQRVVLPLAHKPNDEASKALPRLPPGNAR